MIIQVTSADGTTTYGTCSEAHAASLLRTGVRRGYRVEATRHGGATVVRDVHSAAGVWRLRTVTLTPDVPAGKVTPTMRRDLDLIAGRGGASLAGGGRISAGYIYSIPPAAAGRLISRGLVTIDGDQVAVSLTARLAMLAQDHRTETRQPRGYVRPSDVGLNTIGPWRHGGRVYDRTSVASCVCHWSYPAGDRDDARRRAHQHRQAATAAMVRDMEGRSA